jgi:hypothetical protein
MDFLEAGRAIVEAHRRQYHGVYYMKGGFIGQALSNPIVDTVLSAVASLAAPGIGTALGATLGAGTLGAIGGGVAAGGLSAINGKSIGSDLLSAAGGALGGAGLNGGLSGIGDALTSAGNGIGGLVGDSTLGTDVGSGLSNIGSSIGNGVSNVGSSISQGLGFSSAPAGSGLTPDFTSAFTDGSAYAPSTAASSAPGTIGAGFTPSAAAGSGLGGGSSGGFAALDPSSLGANTGSGFFSPTQALDNSAAGGALGGSGDVAAANGGLSVGSGFNGVPSAADQITQAGNQAIGGSGNMGILSSIFGNSGGAASSSGGGNSNLLNGLLRTGLGQLFNQNPTTPLAGVGQQVSQAAQQYNPYIQTGSAAQTKLGNLEGLNGTSAQQGAQQNWQNTPGYQFQLQQGTGALQNSAAASGGLLNGNTGEALQQYGQGLANTTYQQYLNNLQQQAGNGANAITPQANLIGQGATLSAMPSMYQKNQNNTGIGGILSSLFPSQQNGGGGLLSLL